jgi:transcriptional regulator with XRE-family HTH domain
MGAEKRLKREEAAGFAQRFGANLASRRRAARLSQEELSDLAALHHTAVGQLERGERIPRADTLLKLATVLGVDASALLAGIVWTPPQIDRGSFGIEQPGGESHDPQT